MATDAVSPKLHPAGIRNQPGTTFRGSTGCAHNETAVSNNGTQSDIKRMRAILALQDLGSGAHNRQRQFYQRLQLLNTLELMPDAKRAVVRGPFLAPAVDELGRIERKPQP